MGWVALVICLIMVGGSSAYDSIADSLLREVMSRMTDERELPGNFDLNPLEDYSIPEPLPEQQPRHHEKTKNPAEHGKPRVAKEHRSHMFRPRHDDIIGREPSIRDQEYLEHSSLFGHQYVQGGAGEGSQKLGPDGILNVQVVKTDGVLPAYCNPPNPCPLGYTEKDGCLENFVNTAAFSREYQAAQDCICDTEHMFDCPGSTRENEIDALAQSIQNEGIMDSALDKIVENMQIDGQHKTLVAKKFFSAKPQNPYLEGDKLPVVAKKTPRY